MFRREQDAIASRHVTVLQINRRRELMTKNEDHLSVLWFKHTIVLTRQLG